MSEAEAGNKLARWDALLGISAEREAIAKAVAEERASMLDRIDDLELRLASAISDRDEYRSRIDAMFWCEACDRLEIERKVDSVSAERAAVVAWLHECANDRIAESIERGEHRREEER